MLALIQGRRFRGGSLPRKRRALAYARQRGRETLLYCTV